ncbi:MAG: cytochrome c oxidase subunit, partial [Bryobacterales bacterium]|nr:cytochrome c oxidase subunit [Bryobacterales bacterium]
MLLGPILILLTLAGCGLFYFRPVWFPLPITAEALVFDRQFNWTLWIAGAIFVAVQVVLAWVIVRGLRKTSTQITRRSRRSYRWLEIGWTVATATLFLTLSFAGSRGWAKTPVRTLGKETIEVYSHQFAWHFRYPGLDGRFGVTGATFINDAAGNSFGIDPADKAGRDDITTASLRIPAGR